MVYFINYIQLVSINNLLFKLGMVAHICILSTRQTGESQVLGQLGKFQANQVYIVSKTLS